MNEDRLKALEIAIKLEEDGRKFHIESAEKATSAGYVHVFGERRRSAS